MTFTLAGLVLAAAIGSDPVDDLRLIVPSGRTGPSDLFQIDPATGSSKNVTRSDDAEEIFPAWSPDGKKLAFCCRNKDHLFELYVCDADGSNRKRLTTPPPGSTSVVAGPAWSPDGKRIVYSRMQAGDKGEIRVYTIDTQDDEQIVADGLFPTWSPDGKRIAFVQNNDGKGNRVATANPDGSELKVLMDIGKNPLCMAAWSPDGRHIAYTTETKYGIQVCVIPAAGGTPQQLTHLLGMNVNPLWIGNDRVLFSHFSTAVLGQPGGAYASIKIDATRLVIHPLTRVEQPHPLIRPAAYLKPTPAAEQNPIQQAGFAEPATTKPAVGILPEVILPPFAPGGTPGLAWSPDGKQLAFGLDAGAVVLADFDGKMVKPVEAFRGHEGPVEAVAFSPDGKRLYSTGLDKSVRLWDMVLKGSKAIETDHEASATSLAVSPDGKLVASASLDGLIKVRAADTGKPVREFPLTARKSAVRALAFGKSGVLFAGSGRWEIPVSGGAVAAFDPETGKELWRAAGAFGGVWALSANTDGSKLAGACLDGCVRVWDAKTGQPLGCWQGHDDRVTGVCWSPDGKLVVSCGFDHTVRVWDAASGRGMHILAAHNSPVMRVAFSPTGSHFASSGMSGAVILWRVTSE